jgi:hypothetical protein
MKAYTEVLGWTLYVGGSQVSPWNCEGDPVGGDAGALATPCAAFDGVDVPFRVGMFIQVRYERAQLVVPCLIEKPRSATFLVSAGSGRFVSHIQGVRVRSGPEERQTLPPGPEIRWDTLPWSDTGRRAVELHDARDLLAELEGAVRLHGRG